jgi:hypothetical protein
MVDDLPLDCEVERVADDQVRFVHHLGGLGWPCLPPCMSSCS